MVRTPHYGTGPDQPPLRRSQYPPPTGQVRTNHPYEGVSTPPSGTGPYPMKTLRSGVWSRFSKAYKQVPVLICDNCARRILCAANIWGVYFAHREQNNPLKYLGNKSEIPHLNFTPRPHNFGLEHQVRKPPLPTPSFPYEAVTAHHEGPLRECALELGASGLPQNCTSTCVRSWCNCHASCVATKQKPKRRGKKTKKSEG